MKVRLSIWTFWICVKKTVKGFKLKIVKTENDKNWKLKLKKLNFEELGHQLGKLGQTHVLRFYPPSESTQDAVMAPFCLKP